MIQFRGQGPLSLTTAAAICIGLVSLDSVAHAQASPGNIQGMWWPAAPQADVKPLDGPIAYTPAGSAALAKNASTLAEASGKPTERNDLRPCLPAGPVRILQQPFPVQIISTDRSVVLIYEHNHVFETVYLGDPPGEAEKADPSYMGYSAGTWTKDTLVVRSANFNDQTMLSDMGVPHSDSLGVVRKIRAIDGGKRLEMVSTITDPVMFKKPWSVRQILEARPEASIEEYVCGQATLETRYTRQAAAK